MQFSFEGFIAPRSGSLKLKRVTVVVGSESNGTLNVGRLLLALVGANRCKDPYVMFKRALGKGVPDLFPEGGYAKLEGVEIKRLDGGFEFRRGEIPISQARILPAFRTICVRTIAKLLELPFDLTLVASILVEIVPEPVRLFLNDLLGKDMCDVEKMTFVTRNDLEDVLKKLGLEDDSDLTANGIDEALLKYYGSLVNTRDLLIFEEPAIFKTLKEAIEEVMNAINTFYTKGAYILIETSRMGTIYAINNLVSDGVIKAEDVSAYHVTREGLEELEVVEGLGISLEGLKFAVDIAE